MARIRTIKPEFWTDETVVELSPWERLLFIGLWNFADDQGFIDDKPRRIKMQIFPGDDFPATEVEQMLDNLVKCGLLDRLNSPVGAVLHVRNWERHQRVDKPSRERFDRTLLSPVACSGDDGILGGLREGSGRAPGGLAPEGKGREGKGSTTQASRSSLGRNAREDLEPPPSDAQPTLVEMIVTEYRENSPHGVSSKLAAKVAEEVHQLLRDGFGEDHIRQGLATLRPRKLGIGALATVVDEIANAPEPGTALAMQARASPRPSSTDRAVADALALADQLRAQETA